MSNKIIFLIVLIFLQSCREIKDHNKSNINPGSNNHENQKELFHSEDRDGNSNEKTIVKMYKKNGVYEIPIKINGIDMEFIFDTGAGLISISSTEAAFLYKQGKISEDDFLGTSNFIDANGDISEGVVINLKTVQIGTRTLYNVEASVVSNMSAPLLLGQSAMERFGKVSIDYKKGHIILD
jgi:aspartyl protease family protein